MARAVLFDVDGVLLHGYHASPGPQVRWNDNLLADLGVDPDRFQNEFIFDIFVKQVIVGRMSLIEALDRTLPGLGHRGSSMAFVNYWLTHDSNLNQPLVDFVRRLKAAGTTKLYMATNQEHLRAGWLWQTLGLGEIFDDIFYSARLAASKPNRPFYEAVMRHLGPQAEPPLFFDDVEANVAAARDAGWEAVLFTADADVSAHPWIAKQLR